MSRASHPVGLDAVADLAVKAWRLTFYEAFVSTPHRDNDSDLEGQAAGQRRHLQMLLGCFGTLVAERAVSAGLYPSIDAFFDDVDGVGSGHASAVADGDPGQGSQS